MARQRHLTPLPPLRHPVVVREVAKCRWEILDDRTEELIGLVHRSYGVFDAITCDEIVARPRCFNAAVEAILKRRRALRLPA